MEGLQRLTTGPGQDTDIVVSRDGKRLAYVTRTESTRIWSLPFDASSGPVTGEGQPVTAPGLEAWAHDVSRDGTKLAFIALRGGKRELWEKSLQDDRETLLAADNFERWTPRWSPDATRLAYRREQPDGRRAIALLPAGGGDEQILASAHRGPPDYVGGGGWWHWVPSGWSPDGKWILVWLLHGDPVRAEVAMMPASTGGGAELEARVVARDPAHMLWEAHMSPDARWIALTATPAVGVASVAIHVVPASGESLSIEDHVPITDGTYFDDKPRWAPDGKAIYFVSSRGGFLNVWGIRFDPVEGKPIGEPFQVTTFESPGQMVYPYVSRLDASLCEDRLVLPITEVSGNIWMLDNVD